MRIPLLLALALAALGATPEPAALPRGDRHFALRMSREEVDSLITARKVNVISRGMTFLACESEDPRVEYEQYTFYMPMRGFTQLWKVTIGYRLTATSDDYAEVRDSLRVRLGEPLSEGREADSPDIFGNPGPIRSARASWADPATAVQLGGRWSDSPDRSADRMMVTWTDRRLQRMVDVRRKNGRQAADGSN